MPHHPAISAKIISSGAENPYRPETMSLAERQAPNSSAR
jgi:hypothetical protein